MITTQTAGAASLRFDEALRAANLKSVQRRGRRGRHLSAPGSRPSSPATRSVPTSSRSPGSRRSRGCASRAWFRSSTPAALSTRWRRATRSRAPSSWASAWRLFEGTEYDPQNGAPMNASLADYVVPVNADVPAIDVHFVEHPDFEQNPFGARGVGEIGLAGTAAAITECGLSRHRHSLPRAAAADRRPSVGRHRAVKRPYQDGSRLLRPTTPAPPCPPPARRGAPGWWARCRWARSARWTRRRPRSRRRRSSGTASARSAPARRAGRSLHAWSCRAAGRDS